MTDGLLNERYWEPLPGYIYVPGKFAHRGTCTITKKRCDAPHCNNCLLGFGRMQQEEQL